MKGMPNGWQLKQRQGLPLEIKEGLTANRIRTWYEYWNSDVYVSFSGGKDSTVLLHQVRKLYPKVTAVFVDTGLEYPEIREFVKTIDNVVWLKPKMHFNKVLEHYGFPAISKEQAKYIREVQRGTTKYTENKRRGLIMGRNGYPVGAVSKKWHYLMDQDKIKISDQCCDVMKKRPIHAFEKKVMLKPFVGTMATDSRLRNQSILKYGCNAFGLSSPQSRPLAHWLEKDIWEYIKKHNIEYSKIYDMGYARTGCMFCMFGVHLEKGENRFQRMSRTHPKQYDYCINKLGLGEVLKLIGVDYKPRPRPKFKKRK